MSAQNNVACGSAALQRAGPSRISIPPKTWRNHSMGQKRQLGSGQSLNRVEHRICHLALGENPPPEEPKRGNQSS